MKHWN